MRQYQERLYHSQEIASFRKTNEKYGGLSNMAAGYPLVINNIHILTSEALYQACRFPHMPEVQAKILQQKSPMTAKMVGKPFRSQSRADFEICKVDIMRWCLKIKLAQNFETFGRLLLSTNNLSIVEDSRKDNFWGALHDKNDDEKLVGVNALGRLLMELREQLMQNSYSCQTFHIPPLNIPNFTLLGQPIQEIDERRTFLNSVAKKLCLSESSVIQEPVTLLEPIPLISTQLTTSTKPKANNRPSRKIVLDTDSTEKIVVELKNKAGRPAAKKKSDKTVSLSLF